jgi:hypothetical protein
MKDSQTVDLEEFRQLRAEINNRTTLGNQIFSYTVLAIGAGLAVFDKMPDILLGLSLLSCWFWLLWLDHTGQVFKIAPYIALKLRPRLQFENETTLGWEYFIRKLDSDGFDAQDGTSNFSIPKTGATIGYAAILFAGTAPVLMTIYWFVQMQSSTHDLFYDIRIWGMVGVAAVWLFAVFRARTLINMITTINAAILAAGEKPH